MVALIVVATIYFGAKVVGLRRGPALPAGGRALFLTVWPGVRTLPFAARRPGSAADRRVALQGAVVCSAGITAWILLARLAPGMSPALVGWLGVTVLLTTFHLGLSDVVSGLVRLYGYPVKRLFVDPLKSRSLRDFWSLRWNIAFVEMNQVVFVPALRRIVGSYAIPAAFVLSGLLHELAISLPAGAGFGLPTLYFLLHATAVSLETRLGVTRWPTPLARLWTWSWIIVPLPLLFHRAFRDALVLPLFGVM